MTRQHRSAAWRRIVLAAAASMALPLAAQTGSERNEGLRDNTPRWHAITGARLVLAPGQVVDGGTLVMKDGVIVAAGAGVAVPAGARVWDLPGRTVYAGFIDLASSIGVPAALKPLPPGRPQWGRGSELPPPAGPRPEPRPLAMRTLAAKSRFVRAEQDVAQQLEWKPDDAKAARELGFTAVLAAPQAGVFRGQSALLALADGGDTKPLVIAPRVAQHLALETNNQGDSVYPTSLMGAMALLRQTLLDARWHAAASARPAPGAERVQPNASLAALAPVLAGTQPVVFAADDEQDDQRIARLRDEFGLRVLMQGNGHEYRRVERLKALKLPVIVPLAYPPLPAVDDPDSALDVALASLQHWEQAPSNLAVLDRAGVPVAIGTAMLRDARRDFWPRLRQAVRRGFAPERALAALTTTPAALIGESARLGTLAPGRIANVVVARGDLFASDDAVVELAFVDGRPLPTEAGEHEDLRGSWAVDGSSDRLLVAGTRAAPRVEQGGKACDLVQRGGDWVLRLPCGAAAEATTTIVARQRGERWAGTVQAGSGPLKAWSAQRVAAAVPAAAASSADAAVPPPRPGYPAGAYGRLPPDRPAAVLVKNATVWTQGPAGRLPRADLLVRDGRIAAVGRDLTAPPGAVVVDGSGKHLTPGLIDAHSHIAMARGVNESSHSVTAEVRVADALDATDIAIYRQLAGGLTAANVLHGSANTIGGQSAVIKLRWGASAEELLFDGAKPGIKFALGENVKRSNWGDARRYPTTRMGVEQVLRDSFQAARDYAAEQRAWRANPAGRPEPRRDLQLETLVEILERKRAVHIHSYRADEILMFARLAQELGIEVAAFQHVLEGYKVADAIAAIGAGGSTFSDWWAYKMEVVDAIPFNGALMQRAGVLTSFNSDDAELARRLNTEAAKAVKYGGLSDEEALALVTINAARQLRVERRAGSLEVGKDADFVLWSGPPLSTTSRAEQTWIDGRRYYDLDSDRQLRAADVAERARIVAAALRARPPAGAPPRPGAAPPRATPAPGELGVLAWRQWAEAARTLRHSYSDAAIAHECTEEAP